MQTALEQDILQMKSFQIEEIKINELRTRTLSEIITILQPYFLLVNSKRIIPSSQNITW